MKCAIGFCGHCQFGPVFVCRDGPVFRYDRVPSLLARRRSDMAARNRKPRLAVWKFASCDGCQLSLLDCEDELLAVAGAVDIAYFPRRPAAPSRDATTSRWSKAPSPRPTTRNASRTSARAPARWSRSAPARRRAASRRCATSPM